MTDREPTINPGPARGTAPEPPPPGIPVMPDVQQHLVKPNEPAVARVFATDLCTASAKSAGIVRHIAIDVAGTPLESNFIAGQSFGVIAPGTDSKGRPHKLRLYSIASPSIGEDGHGRVLSTTVKRIVGEDPDDHTLFLGVCSNYLCDLEPGDEVLVTGPAGKRFVLPADHADHDYIFFATGTGIAPFRAMLADLFARPCTSKVVLVMGSPYTSDLLYHDHFLQLERDHDRFTYLTAISRERQPDCTDRKLYVQDRLETHAGLLGPMLASTRTLVYICGIAGMELGIFRQLAARLDPAALSQYLRLDPGLASDPGSWTRKMIPRQIRPTRRVFLEVY